MTMPWTEYVIRRRAEGWSWGWELNDQLKTDPAMQPPVADARMPHPSATMSRATSTGPILLPPLAKGSDDVTAADDDERRAGPGADHPAP